MMQEIYICLDDSGKLTHKEHISVYGGVVFTSKKEKDKFITQYRSIINDIKCSYCENCNKKCPEIKNTNVKKKDKRRLMNYIKKYYVIALIIKNDNVYRHIKDNKAAKGRFTDYALRRLIKDTIKVLINVKTIDAKKPLKIIVNIDQQTTKTNGYYTLRDGLIEELKYGISNYNYCSCISKIIYADLEVIVSYQESSKSYVIQAADLLAGTIRKTSLDNQECINLALNKFVDYQIIIP